MCEVCGGPRQERHHLRPKAAGGRDKQGNYAHLCRECHKLAHRLYGPGNDYTGPTVREAFVGELRAFLAGLEPQRSQIWAKAEQDAVRRESARQAKTLDSLQERLKKADAGVNWYRRRAERAENEVAELRRVTSRLRQLVGSLLGLDMEEL